MGPTLDADWWYVFGFIGYMGVKAAFAWGAWMLSRYIF